MDEIWTIVEEHEYNYLWAIIENEFQFCPKHSNPHTFHFKMPCNAYNIEGSRLYDANEDSDVNQWILSVFIDCMGNDPYMYALDYMHACFKYDPRIKEKKPRPTFIADRRFENGGYNAYFPRFYPDGEYYLFVSKAFTWGYFTHPWLKKLWVFGDCLMQHIRSRMEWLEIKPTTIENESQLRQLSGE